MIKNLEGRTEKPVEPTPEEILLRNLESRHDPETIVNYAIAKYGEKVVASTAAAHLKRPEFGVLSLLCDYYEYSYPAKFGREFQSYYERHLKGTATPKDSIRTILKRHLSGNS